MDFFSLKQGMQFELFGPLHFSLLAFVLVATVLIYTFREKLRAFGHFKLLSWIFAIILFMNMTIYYGGLMLTGDYDIKLHLPLEFCFITGYILMYVLISKNQKIYSIIFYYTIIGPMPAMLWPNLSGTWDRYVFYQFIISHHFMILVSFYCIIVFQYEVRARDAIKAFICGNAVFLSVSVLNYFWGSNFIMAAKLPDHIVKLFPFVKYINYPVFWLEVCGIAFMFFGVWLAKLFQRDKRIDKKAASAPTNASTL